MKLRLGLVGLGPSWANRHRPALQALAERFEVRAVCDPVAHRAEQVAAQLGARAVDGFRAIASAEDIDAVAVLSARWFGALPILAACDQGKAVYCGASVDLDSNQAATLRDRVRQSGIAFMAEFPNRLAPATLRLQELIATRLGTPRMIFCNQRDTGDNAGASGGGDASMRHLVEMVDWCRYVMGREATAVVGAAHTAEPGVGCEDYSLMTLEFADPTTGTNGATAPTGSSNLAQISYGRYVSKPLSEATAFRRPADMQVVCESGIAFVDLPATLVWFDSAGQHTESLESETPVGEQLLMHFHRAVSSLVLKTASLEDAYRATSLVIAARQSYREGRRIAVDLGPTPTH
ncbi:MAG: Gfo/Idh/MocA family oxidoreductase [Planctomycetota bacterium]